MRGHIRLAQVADELRRVEGLVGAERPLGCGAWRLAFDHLKSGPAFGPAGRRGRICLHDEPVPVFRQWVADEAQLRPGIVALAIELGIRDRRRGVRVVLALFAMELAFSLAHRRRRCVRSTLGAEALERGRGLDERAIHREVLIRQEALQLGVPQNRLQELRRDIGVQQPIAVFRERRVVPNRIVDAEPYEPAEQQTEEYG